jgi:hypothetical protein
VGPGAEGAVGASGLLPFSSRDRARGRGRGELDRMSGLNPAGIDRDSFTIPQVQGRGLKVTSGACGIEAILAPRANSPAGEEH